MATGVASWSQTAASNATADANVNWAEGMAPSQVNDSARAVMASVAKWRDDMAGTLISSGSGTAYTLTTNQVFASLSALDGRKLTVRFGFTNGTAPTLSIDGLAAKAITVDSATAVTSGAIRANSIHDITYDNSAGVVILHSGHSLTEPGRIAAHGAATAPAGWLLCDGTAYSRATYADLFANISTTWGSSDGSSFNVPDFGGRVLAGKEASATRLTTAIGGVQGATLANAGGSQTKTIAQANLPNISNLSVTISSGQGSHTHVLGAADALAAGSAVSGVGSFQVVANTISAAVLPAMTGTANLGGSGTDLGIVQPTIIVNYFIKT